MSYTDLVYSVKNNFNESEKNKLSHSFSDILLACSFNGQTCTHHEFREEFYKDGNCTSFNTGVNISDHVMPLKKSFRAGSNYGLKLTLYVNFYEKLMKQGTNKYVGASIKIGKI